MAFESEHTRKYRATRVFLFVCACVLIVFVPRMSTAEEVAPTNMIEPSDNWGMYFSNMGGHPAMTVFDDGISGRIAEIDLPNSIKVKLYLNDVRDDGLPTSEEGERLMQIGPAVENAISQHGGLFLGRVTTNSVRWNVGLAPDDTHLIEQALLEESEKHNFRYEVFVAGDPNRSVYWDDLYPSDDDRQVMGDMDVKRALADNGDDQYAERPVYHWVYFDRRDDAERFAGWGRQQGYLDVEVVRQKSGLLARVKWLVQMNHRGTMVLDDITHHTIKLSNQARDHNGVYDGWETQVTN